MPMKQKHMDMYFRHAEASAQTSSAVRRKVGAVAVKDNKVIATGYNGLPSGIDGECEEWKPNTVTGDMVLVTKPEVRHAEKNLLLNLARSTESSDGCTVFCTTACCKFCAYDLVDAGIKEFYYRDEYNNSEGLDYLKQMGVVVHHVSG